jgi:hypothetical protein
MPAVLAGIEQNHPGLVDLLLHGRVYQSPEASRAIEKLEAAGDHRRAEKLRQLLVPGCLRAPIPDDRSMEELRTRLPPLDTHRDRASLIELARTGTDLDKVRSAMKELVHDPAPEVIELFVELTRHRQPRVRSLALRCVRRTADRRTYLQAASTFLSDSRAEVQRSAIRAVSHGRYRPAIPALVDLLQHRSHVVREAAGEGLHLFGELALRDLMHARRRARPDRRETYQKIIDAIQQSLADPDEED